MVIGYESSTAPIDPNCLAESKLQYDFIYWIHGRGHSVMNELAERASDGDIIAVEGLANPNIDARYIEEVQAYSNAYIAHELDKDGVKRILGYFRANDDDAFMPADALIIQKAHRKGRDKHFAFIDMFGNDRTYADLHQVTEQALSAVRKSLTSGDTEDIRSAQRAFLRAMGVEHQYREPIVVTQLLNIGAVASQLFPDRSPIKISVVEGLAHTATSHALSRLGFNISRTFFSESSEQPKAKVLYSFTARIIRAFTYDSDANVEQSWIDKSVLETLCRIYKFDFLLSGERSLAAMPNETATAILERVGAISERRTIMQKKKIALIGKMLNGSLGEYYYLQPYQSL